MLVLQQIKFGLPTFTCKYYNCIYSYTLVNMIIKFKISFRLLFCKLYNQRARSSRAQRSFFFDSTEIIAAKHLTAVGLGMISGE